jgi:hypothetical protein
MLIRADGRKDDFSVVAQPEEFTEWESQLQRFFAEFMQV